MFSRILVVTDLSKASYATLPCLGALRSLGAMEAVLFHAVNVRDVGAIPDSLRSTLTEHLLKQRSILASLGFLTQHELVVGLTQVEVNEAARKHGSTLAVVGSHGEGILGERPLGGVVTAVVQGARLPVLIIRLLPDAPGSLTCHVAPRGLLNNVVYATDFSDNSERAFLHMEKLVRSGGGRVALLHVQESPRLAHLSAQEIHELDRLDRIRLNRLRDRLVLQTPGEVQCVVLHGTPAQEIARYAEDTEASLIVVGNQGRGYAAELLLGSVSRQLARNAPCSVLLIPGH